MMHHPFESRHGRLVGWVVICAAVVVLGGCSGRDDSPLELVSDDSRPTAEVEVESLTVAPDAIWGMGRALRAARAVEGSMVIVSTTGVQVVTDPEQEPRQIDVFDRMVQIVPVAASADGSSFAVAVSPEEIRRYSLDSAATVDSYALSPGITVRELAIRERDGALVADTATGPIVWSDDPVAPPVPLTDAAPAGRTAMLPDGTMVTPITATADLAIHGVDGSTLMSLVLPDGATVLDAHASPDGATVAISIGIGQNAFERTDSIVVLDTVSFEQLSLISVERVLDPLAWDMTNTSVVVSDGATIKAWAFDGSGGIGATPVDPPVTRILPASDGFVTTHTDGSLLRWRSDGTEPTVIDPGGDLLEYVEMGEADVVTTVDRRGVVASWDVVGGTQLALDERFASGEATDVAVSAGGDSIGVSSSSGDVAILDTALAERSSFAASEGPAYIGSVAFDPKSGALATGLQQRRGDLAFDDTVQMWDPNEHASLFQLYSDAEEVAGCGFFYSRLRFDPDGTQLAVASHDFSVVIVDAATGVVVNELPGPATVLDLGFTPDGDLLVATYDDSSVSVWETSDLAQVANYRSGMGGYQAIDILPDSATMVVSDITGAISVVDLMTGAPLRSMAGATFRTPTMALSPDGAVVAAPTADATISFWSTQSGELLATASGHTQTVTGLAFGTDGNWLVSSSMDGTVRRWSLHRGV